MKTATEQRFEELVKNAFHLLLKPLGFKKKRYNFYLQRKGLGQIINLQKSDSYSRDHIHFTINTGIFVPEYWKVCLNFHNRDVPDFPTEPECLIRRRIGRLKYDRDVWYDLTEKTDVDKLTLEMQDNMKNFILPHFERFTTVEDILEISEKEKFPLEPLGKMILFSEFERIEQAKAEFKRLMNEKGNPYFLQTVKKFGQRYGLDK